MSSNALTKFNIFNAKTLDDAVTALSKGNSEIIAGGTDLLHTRRFYILREYPDTLVNINTIDGLEYIREENGILKIGALTKLEDIAQNDIVSTKCSALAQAASKTASPHIREMGTISGNICQLNRCWYFRKPENRFDCIRKGGNMCYAMAGENRYHSIFGAVKACVAVNPSDTAPALVALNAKIVTTKQTIDAENFWNVDIPGSTVLASDEIVTEIQIPAQETGAKSAFIKFAIRSSIDFPIVNCAAMISGSDARICLNAVYNTPKRVTAAEDAIKGKAIDETNAEAAGAAAVSGAIALTYNKWKIQVAKTMVKRAILACK
jgi:xanthine dehydrogenase YagS FAD-binding subunit